MERKEIPLKDLVLDEYSSRKAEWTGSPEDQQLLASIKDVGLIHDVCVRLLDNGKYSVFAGWRRVLTKRQAGDKDIECKVLDVDDVEALKISAGENIGRKDLTDYEMMAYVNTFYQLIMDSKNIPKRGKYDTKALNTIAKSLYGRVSDEGRTLVQQQLRIGRLPKRMKLLLKKPEERTESEKHDLKEAGIDPSYSMDYLTLDKLGAVAREMGIDNPETREEATEKALKIVGKLKLAEGQQKAQYSLIMEFGKKLKEGKSYAIALKEIEESPEIGIKEFVQTALRISGNHYTWHKRMLEETHSKSNVELVRKVYFEYLEREAKRREWT